MACPSEYYLLQQEYMIDKSYKISDSVLYLTIV